MHQEITKNYKYKFSVVIPIYNVEDYVEETILSVINQTIGFEENIQMILVNDGSPDKSEDICLKYKDKYPNNIVYVKQKNAGVSAARNKGMNYIEGKYVNFLDSDDKWDLDVFEKVYEFFEINYNNIDVVACRLRLFEAVEGFKHPLDYKFNKDKIVDILQDYDNIQMHAASTFIKYEAIDNEFDTRIKYAEDAIFISYLILKKTKYGVMKSAIYNYRKRQSGDSAIQMGKSSKSYYIDTPKYGFKNIINYTIKVYDQLIPYMQFLVMYDLQWRIKSQSPDILNNGESKEYNNIIKELLSYIDDYIICKQKNINLEYKIYALNLKHNKDITKEFRYEHYKLYFNNICLHNLKNRHFLQINIMEIENNYLKMEGKIKTILSEEDYEVYILDNENNRYELQYYDISIDNKYSMNNDVVFKGKGFKVNVPLENVKKIKFMILYKGMNLSRLKLDFGKFGKLTNKSNNCYYQNGRYIVKYSNNKICIYNYSKKKHVKYEIYYMKQLLKDKRQKVVLYRILYFILKSLIKTDLWIITDRTHVANDNGMHLFKYINNNKNNKINVFFAIDKKSKDYKKLKENGKVLKINSLRYKMYFLLSKNIISSQADEWVINAFDKEREYLKDLYKFNFVFLQHGITKDDLSRWLNKQNKNIRLFITSVKGEYKSIINGKYAYDSESVKLTGFPRYDALCDSRDKQIVFMPTWRKNIISNTVGGTSIREYNPNFKDTEYFKFYNNLINDKRILNILREKGYKAKFCIHPSFENQFIDFTQNSEVEISGEIVDYQYEFKKNALLITDFSSVAFDFAYLKKPIIYTQFDIKTFYEGHLYDKDYFDYERDGFGEVCYDYEKSVNTIVNMIENDCKIDRKYIDRIDNFYKYNDKENCKRVYDEILKLK